MQSIQFISVTPEQLQTEITKSVKSQLDDFLKHFIPKQPNDYLTRQQVAQLFNVDISTVSNWSKSGKIKPLGLGSRVYYLRSDIEASLKPLQV